jgi:hypothetical protein
MESGRARVDLDSLQGLCTSMGVSPAHSLQWLHWPTGLQVDTRHLTWWEQQVGGGGQGNTAYHGMINAMGHGGILILIFSKRSQVHAYAPSLHPDVVGSVQRQWGCFLAVAWVRASARDQQTWLISTPGSAIISSLQLSWLTWPLRGLSGTSTRGRCWPSSRPLVNMQTKNISAGVPHFLCFCRQTAATFPWPISQTAFGHVAINTLVSSQRYILCRRKQ